MSDRKLISINPDLFRMSSNNTTRKRQAREGGKAIKIKSSQPVFKKTMRNKILKHIREEQEKNYKKLFEETASQHPAPVSSAPKSDFENSIEYMKMKLEEKPASSPLNTTIKHHRTTDQAYFTPFHSPVSPVSPVPIHPAYEWNPPPSLGPGPSLRIKPPPPQYGCLKNGQLPTYRHYMKQQTMKQYPSYPPLIKPPEKPLIQAPPVGSFINNVPPSESPREDPMFSNSPLQQLIEKRKVQQLMDNAKSHVPKNLKYLKQKKTLRRTYYVGKSNKLSKIGVLVSNRTIRKERTTQAHLLKQVDINTIKKFLIKKGFVTVGTTAPNDVLRQMYENIHLIGGDIYNHNPENLLYNYLHE